MKSGNKYGVVEFTHENIDIQREGKHLGIPLSQLKCQRGRCRRKELRHLTYPKMQRSRKRLCKLIEPSGQCIGGSIGTCSRRGQMIW